GRRLRVLPVELPALLRGQGQLRVERPASRGGLAGARRRRASRAGRRGGPLRAARRGGARRRAAVAGLVAMKAAALLLAGACAALACGGPQTPADTARAFLERVSRNPVSALPLLSEDFHAGHALRHSVPGDTGFLLRRPAPLPSDPAARRRELEAAQLGWLIAQKGARVHFLVAVPIEERIEGARRWVVFG